MLFLVSEGCFWPLTASTTLGVDFFGFKIFPQMSLNFGKTTYHDKVTCFWAFEVHVPYQKYQQAPIVVSGASSGFQPNQGKNTKF